MTSQGRSTTAHPTGNVVHDASAFGCLREEEERACRKVSSGFHAGRYLLHAALAAIETPGTVTLPSSSD